MVTGDPICPHCGSHWWSAHACSGALLGQRYETSDPMDPHKLAESVRELSERNDQLSAELSALKNRVEAAEKEVARMRRMLAGVGEAMRTAAKIHADPKSKPWGRQHVHDFVDGVAYEIDAALQAASESTEPKGS